MVEYRFSADDTWKVGGIGKDSLESYRSLKFKTWLEMVKTPTCEAQFRRLLQTGLVCTMFDPNAFPTPDKDKGDYEVVDAKTGKKVQIPHPVYELRVWNAEHRKYENEVVRL